MNNVNIEHMFAGISFQKSSAEIKEKASAKVLKLQNKIEERQKRITDLRTEYDIDDAALISLLVQARENQRHRQVLAYSYAASNSLAPDKKAGAEERTVGAGVVQNLLTENDCIQTEKDQVKRLNLIISNIGVTTHFASGNGQSYICDRFVLSCEELEYLGF